MIDTPETRLEFRELIAGVYAYYRKDLSKFVLSLWWNGCHGYELDEVRAILSSHIQDPDRGGFLPLINDVTRALKGTASDRTALAWGKVREAMAWPGRTSDVVFDDPAIHCAIVDLGGWVKLCSVADEDLGYEQHRFTQSYRAYAKTLPPTYPRVLVGDRSPDAEFERRGVTPPGPKAIGDKVLARMVIDGRAAAIAALPAGAPQAPQLGRQS